MTDPDDFAALRAALEAGPTPGPWESTAYEQDRRYGKQEIVDCEYIAAASPEVIARLLAELDALRARVVTLPEPDYYSVSDCDIRPRLMHCRSDVERHLKDLEAIGRQPVPWDGNVQGLYREATVRRIIADAAMKDKP